MAVAWIKAASPAGRTIFAMRRASSGTDYLTLLARDVSGSNKDSAALQLRTSVAGITNLGYAAGVWPFSTAAVLDSLSVPGTTDLQLNNTTKQSTANSWLAGTQLIDAKAEIANGAFSQAADSGIFIGGIISLADPGAMRPDAKAWLAARGSITL
jgi:hypothetical protein